MSRPLDIVVLGLSLASSWGNGHATTFRSLLRGVHRLGHRVLFLERQVPWYDGDHRDLPDPDFCDLAFYGDRGELEQRFAERLRAADAVIVGSYVPEGVPVIDWVLATAEGVTGFYDIDTPVTLARLERGDEAYLARRQIPGFDVYFSFTGGPTLERLQSEFGARSAEALYCSVEAARYAPTGETPVWDLGYLGTYSDDRQPTLEALLIEPARRLPHCRFVVAGPQYPATIDWPGNVDRIEHLPPAEHASFYSRQRYTLNVTRADMIAAGWSPSVRLFEAAACGTPIVSDSWKGLEAILPGGVRTVQGTDEVVALLQQADAAQRSAMAEAARRVVLADHTGDARAAEFAAAIHRLLEAGRDREIARTALHPVA
ncbi:glycosyltransferase [Aurantimonas sp. MSK8Z-1]|uniref:CgeB family protein n=1 Tax=Mangrovibrevibacter kandeliae TaxID=2968473 RepID=UPI002118B51B|nr:glycosyltransferase [Aurantimonas sp. MSK8Z-1]MCW4115833.1 glycosyltransferase [Aurantimonas sp. MSK8Z-1]